MATNHTRLPQRNRVLPQRKVDENATSRHSRQASSIPVVGANRLGVKDLTARPTIGRQILSEVTTTANRRENIPRTTALGKEKEEVVGTKRSRSNSASIELPQRIPFGKSQAVPPVTNVVPARAPLSRAPRPQIPVFTRKFQRVRDHVIAEDEREVVEDDYRMDVEEDDVMLRATTADQLEVDEVEEQVMVPSSDLPDEDEGVDMDSPAMEVEEETQVPIAPAVWPALDPHKAATCRKQLQNIRETFLDVAEEADPSMVSEYADDIFEYMNELEEEVMPDPDYMKLQGSDLNWQTRFRLVDWMLAIHVQFHLLPETLWIAANILDRFLSRRKVNRVKVQLVAIASMFIACKYEEVMAVPVDEFVATVKGQYTKEDIFRAETHILSTLEFHVSHYCSPYSWMRKISRADDYELQTRTLSKFLSEVMLLDHRFLRAKPSLIAALGMYSARRMLGGDWNPAFVFHSGYTEDELMTGHRYIVETIATEDFQDSYVFRKYAHKKFLKASMHAMRYLQQIAWRGPRMS